MTKINSSPDRHTFQRNNYIERCAEEGKEPNQSYLDFFDSFLNKDKEWLEGLVPENNLEYDLRTSDYIKQKCECDYYAQNLYAALCNNDFMKNDVWPILTEETCGYSWRYSGGIVADIRGKGDYIDWYCSGIRGELSQEEFLELSEEDQENYLYFKNKYVGEGYVTEEIRNDLLALGWLVVDDKEGEL